MDSGERPGRPRRRGRPTGRHPLPAHLARQRVEIDVPDADKICACGHRKTRIGEAVSEKLEYVPASLRVIETARFKYAPCGSCTKLFGTQRGAGVVGVRCGGTTTSWPPSVPAPPDCSGLRPGSAVEGRG